MRWPCSAQFICRIPRAIWRIAFTVFALIFFTMVFPRPGQTQNGKLKGCLTSAIASFSEKAKPILARANPFAVDAATKGRKLIKKQARGLLGRRLTEEQARAIQRANEIGSVDGALSLAESARRSRLLRAGGFKEDEVRTLAKHGVLENHPGTLAPVAIVPDSAFTHTVQLRAFDRNVARDLQNPNARFHYVIDVDDQIFLIDDTTGAAVSGIPNEPIWIARNQNASSSLPQSIIVKESGVVKNVDDRIVFHARQGSELSAAEIDRSMEQLRRQNPELKLGQRERPGVLKHGEARVLTCIDIMSGQLAGKSFVKDSLIAGNLISVGSIAAAEALGSGRLNSADGTKVIAADLLGGNANMLLSSTITKLVLQSNMSLTKQVATRAALGLVSTRVQDQIYKAVLPGDGARERADALTDFNMWHFYLKLPLNVLIDRGLMKKLPVALFDICRKGGTLNVVLSTQAVRIYERSASTAAYYFLRGAFVDEGNQPDEKGAVKKVRQKLEKPLKLPKHVPLKSPQKKAKGPSTEPAGEPISVLHHAQQ